MPLVHEEMRGRGLGLGKLGVDGDARAQEVVEGEHGACGDGGGSKGARPAMHDDDRVHKGWR